ncbi:MAG: hypothetical protein KGZ88_20875 [Methylomicrobium sp.]|jgi:hypothetical protein|nr:hypothetical protein [Methylomicrobium sp.]
MSETQKIIGAVLGVIIIGFLIVGTSKEKTPEEMEAASMMLSYSSMQTMAGQKCPAAVLKETGEQVYFPSETKSDKATFITLMYKGETEKFKNASCTLHLNLGGISELIIDDKVVIKKQVK